MTMEKDLEDWEVYDELKGKKKGNFRMPGAGSVTEVRFVFLFWNVLLFALVSQPFVYENII